MEHTQITQIESKTDSLVEAAAIKISAYLNEKLLNPINPLEVVKELNCLKYGIMTDNIPLNMEVYKALDETGISILHKTYINPRSNKCYVNNPAGRRTIIDRSIKPEIPKSLE